MDILVTNTTLSAVIILKKYIDASQVKLHNQDIVDHIYIYI